MDEPVRSAAAGDDGELLRRYASSASAEAFTELVRRHLPWVAASARRQVRDPGMAEDVVQAAFILLARKPPRIAPGQTVGPWLFRVVRNTARTALRAEARRRRHEGKAASMHSEQARTSDQIRAMEWAELEPHLDDLVERLGDADRRVIVLRFFEQKSMSDVGRAVGVSEDAARKRVERAIERLRAIAARRGIGGVPLAGALAGLMMAHSVDTAHAAAAGAPGVASAAMAAAKAGMVGTSAGTLAGMVAESVARVVWVTRAIAAAVVLSVVGGAALLLARPGGAAGDHGLIRTADAKVPARVSVAVPTTRPSDGTLRVGYVVSHYTVTGPGRAFNGSRYTHAHPKALPALAAEGVEFWAVLEPGTQDDPDIRHIVGNVFAGRWLDGGNVDHLRTCDVIVAAAVRNATPEVLSAVDRVVSEDGRGLLIWVPIGGTAPGSRDPVMRRLNALSDEAWHPYSFSLDWLDATVVGAHPVLGGVSGLKGTAVKFRPETMGGLGGRAVPLVEMTIAEQNGARVHPVYASTLGRGRVMHFGFATYTQVPREFDRMVGGGFAVRCLNWLAGRPVEPVVGHPTTREVRP